MLKFWVSPRENAVYILIDSSSRPGMQKVCEISDSGVRCLPIEEAKDVADADNIVGCPACDFGRKCNRARQIEQAIGITVKE